MNGYLSPSEVERLATDMPAFVRFTESGRVAVWRDDSMSWSVTGFERAWGSPTELVRTFGPYIEIDESGNSALIEAAEYLDELQRIALKPSGQITEDENRLWQTDTLKFTDRSQIAAWLRERAVLGFRHERKTRA